MRPTASEYDVVVIGGGPAGSTVAALTAESGLRVLLLDRETFPRFRIGESLMPATYWTLERLGVLEYMKCSDFPQKHSVQFFTASGRAARPFYFSETDAHESSQSWQVDRAKFDKMLLDNAREKGAEICEGISVRDLKLANPNPDEYNATVSGVEIELADGARRGITAGVTVDATGQSALIAKRLRLRQLDRNLLHCAFFTRFSGAWRGEGIDEGGTLIMHTEAGESWFWYIPLPGGEVSVGVVGPIHKLKQGRDSNPQAVFDSELARCVRLQEKLEGAEQTDKVGVLKDFSYTSKRIAGDGWVLAGDAFGFLDPIYSTGVFLALKGGEMGADSIIDAFAVGDLSGSRLGRHGPEFLAGMEAMRKMVYAYYSTDFNFAEFLKAYPDCTDQLVHLLIGNVYRKDVTGLLESMDRYRELPTYRPMPLAEA